MGFWQDIRQAVYTLANLDEIFWSDGYQAKMQQQALQRDYFYGNQRKQIRVKPNQADDNITLNFIGLIVDRGVSMLLGQGIEFDLPGEPEVDAEGNKIEQPNQQYIDEVWAANKVDILLQKAAQFGGVHGTVYLKVIPEGTGVESAAIPGHILPRLIVLDPVFMTIDTLPEDIDTVLRYTMRYTVNLDGQDKGRKEEIERAYEGVNAEGYSTQPGEDIAAFMDAGWWIREYIENAVGRWDLISEELWEYPFPPVVHWQNLPLAGNCYGKADVTPDVIELQDRINFVASNISKIIRYHAHPKTWGRASGSGEKQSWGADEMVIFPSDQAMIQNLEMQSDLASSQAYLLNLRQSLFDISRTVDITSLADKLGALTNFGLRVLFYDAIAKLQSKQELYGEALTDLNYRMLVLAEHPQAEEGGGEVVWPDPLPTSDAEEIAGLTFDLDHGLASKETVAQKRGYDAQAEQARIDEERTSEQENGNNIGSLILRNFNNGLGEQ